MTDEPVLDPEELRASVLRWVDRRMRSKGEMRIACVPSLLDEYVERIGAVFRGFGKGLTAEQGDHLRGILEPLLIEGFGRSPHSWLLVEWEPDGTNLSYTIRLQPSSLTDEYAHWLETREPPLFGAHPDAKVTAIVESLTPPRAHPILEIGAGTGRNALPLARRGHSVDAVDITKGFLDQIREVIRPEGLQVRPIVGDVLDPEFALVADRYALMFAAQVVATHFRSTAQLRTFCRRAAAWVRPGGLFLFNLFLAVDGYEPDEFTRQVAQHLWSPLFTRAELASAMDGLPFDLLSDESTYDFERDNTPDWAWPPTSWFPQWSRGRDLFKFADPETQAPIELRWLLFQKTG